MKLLYIAAIFVATFQSGHAGRYEPPQETDVESPDYCTTNSDGFGGVPVNSGMEDVQLTTIYELTYTPGTSTTLDEIVFKVEQGIANYLLQESNSFSTCSKRRIMRGIESTRRKLQDAKAVAVTVNPRDEVADGVECEGTPVDGTECVVVDGAFGVYFMESGGDYSATMSAIEEDVKASMDDGALVTDEIVSVAWRDSLTPSTPVDQSNEPDPPTTVGSISNNRNISTGTIIGASVGGLLILGLAALYGRRSEKLNDEETLTAVTPGGSTAV